MVIWSSTSNAGCFVGTSAPIVGSIPVVTTPVTTLVNALVILAFRVTAISRHLKLWLQETVATLISRNMGDLRRWQWQNVKKEQGRDEQERERERKQRKIFYIAIYGPFKMLYFLAQPHLNVKK
jgi:hypothetical protein